ncbi:MAG: hypothetical protein QM642_04760 [Edaphocola sp.]
MERIQNILQRIQEIYYGKNQKTAIDIDLMMDYARVLYADLIEWRREFGAAPFTSEPARKNEAAKEAVPASPEDLSAQDETIEQAQDTPVPEEQLSTEIPDEPEPHPLPADTPTVQSTAPEKEQETQVQAENKGISFEPPAAQVVRHVVKEELVEEPEAVPVTLATEPAPAAKDIPLPEPEFLVENKSTPTLATPIPHLFTPTTSPKKNLRAGLGINDKYLFLNELFNNDKQAFEDALDALSEFSTEEDAVNWTKTHLAPKYKWHHEDSTVEAFHKLIQKVFAER